MNRLKDSSTVEPEERGLGDMAREGAAVLSVQSADNFHGMSVILPSGKSFLEYEDYHFR